MSTPILFPYFLHSKCHKVYTKKQRSAYLQNYFTLNSHAQCISENNALHRSTFFCIWSVFRFLLYYSSFTSNFGSKVDNENLHIRSVRLVSSQKDVIILGNQKIMNQSSMRSSGFQFVLSSDRMSVAQCGICFFPMFELSPMYQLNSSLQKSLTAKI